MNYLKNNSYLQNKSKVDIETAIEIFMAQEFYPIIDTKSTEEIYKIEREAIKYCKF